MKTAKRREVAALLGSRRSAEGEVSGNARVGRGLIYDGVSSTPFAQEDGQSLVEFALVAPILIAVLMGIFEFGIAFYNQLQLTQAVGQGALYLQQQDPTQSPLSDPCQSTLTYIENSAPTLTPANITLTLTMGGNPPVTAHSCTADASELTSGQNVTVKATYPCNITLFAINLDHLSSWNFNCNLSAQVTEYQY